MQRAHAQQLAEMRHAHERQAAEAAEAAERLAAVEREQAKLERGKRQLEDDVLHVRSVAKQLGLDNQSVDVAAPGGRQLYMQTFDLFKHLPDGKVRCQAALAAFAAQQQEITRLQSRSRTQEQEIRRLQSELERVQRTQNLQYMDLAGVGVQVDSLRQRASGKPVGRLLSFSKLFRRKRSDGGAR